MEFTENTSQLSVQGTELRHIHFPSFLIDNLFRERVLRGRDHLEDLDVEWRIILKCNFNK